MPNHFNNIKIKNYRSLAEVNLKLGSLNLFFGPNGVGKTTILDALWFIRGCSAQGLQSTIRNRNYGRDLLWANADDQSSIFVEVETAELQYSIEVGFASGKPLDYPGERLVLKNGQKGTIYTRKTDDRMMVNIKTDQGPSGWVTTGKGDDRLYLRRMLDHYEGSHPVFHLNQLIFDITKVACRYFQLHELKRFGSESGPDTALSDLGRNVLSAFRNLRDRKDAGDKRYDVILKYFKQAFPEIENIRTEQTSPTLVYAYFKEQGLDRELPAFSMSEGMLQFICILVALFGDPFDQPTVMLFDEPEISLHPWPLQVLSQAMRYASESCNRQIMIATHSPTLMSAFDTADCFVVGKEKGKTSIRPVLDDKEVKDLLEQYSLGTLYLAESVGSQNPALVNGVAP